MYCGSDGAQKAVTANHVASVRVWLETARQASSVHVGSRSSIAQRHGGQRWRIYGAHTAVAPEAVPVESPMSA